MLTLSLLSSSAAATSSQLSSTPFLRSLLTVQVSPCLPSSCKIFLLAVRELSLLSRDRCYFTWSNKTVSCLSVYCSTWSVPIVFLLTSSLVVFSLQDTSQNHRVLVVVIHCCLDVTSGRGRAVLKGCDIEVGLHREVIHYIL